MAASGAPSSTGEPDPGASPFLIRRTYLRLHLSDLPPSPPSPSPVTQNMTSGWDEPEGSPPPRRTSGWDEPGYTPYTPWPTQRDFAEDAREVARAQEQALAATYDALVQQVALLRARPDSDEASSSSDSSLSSIDALGRHMLWFQDYLEFILRQRECPRWRAAQEPPPPACTRRSPCDDCGHHEGSNVPSSFWHSLSDEEVELHLAQYLRVRDQLPAWRPNPSPSPPASATADQPAAPDAENNAPAPAAAVGRSGVDGNFIGPRAAAANPAGHHPAAPASPAAVASPAASAASSEEHAAPGPGLNLVAMIAEPLIVAPRGFPIPMRLLLSDDERVLLERNVDEARHLWGQYLALPSSVALFNVIFDCAAAHAAPTVALAFVLPGSPEPSSEDVPDLSSDS